VSVKLLRAYINQILKEETTYGGLGGYKVYYRNPIPMRGEPVMGPRSRTPYGPPWSGYTPMPTNDDRYHLEQVVRTGSTTVHDEGTMQQVEYELKQMGIKHTVTKQGDGWIIRR